MPIKLVNRRALRCCGLCLLVFVSCLGARAQVVLGDDFTANTFTSATVLQGWYNGGGLWNTTGWWNGANCVDALEAAITLQNGGPYLNTISNTFSLNSSGNFLNSYYDDEGWWAEAWIRAFDLSGNAQYLNMAKTIFRDMTNGWGNPCGGGIWWNKSQTYKNAIPNELFLLVAARLHQRTPGDNGSAGSYLYWATNEWNWFKGSGMLNGQSLINDGLTTNCANNGQTTWSYNQGVILAGLTDLYKITGDTNYLKQAEAIADAVLSHLVSANAVLQEPCETGSGCGGGDVPEFKGIFARHIAYLYDTDHKPSYFGFMFTNAHSAWFNDRNPSAQFGLKWTGPFDSADAARHSSAMFAVCGPASPTTSLLGFSRGSGEPCFNHSVGRATGTVAWAAGPSFVPAPGFIQAGPFLTSLPVANHVAHFRISVDSTSTSSSSLIRLDVVENSAVLTAINVPWNAFGSANQPWDIRLPFANTVSGGALQFRVYWYGAAGAPTLTVNDISVDGFHNWTAANLAHDIGRLDGHNLWEADRVRDTASGYMVRGPGTVELGAGNYSATFELAVDNFNWDNSTIATISVVETNSGAIVARRDIARSEFTSTLFQSFTVYFTASAGGQYDYRTYWYYGANAPRLTQRSVVVNGSASAAFLPIPLASGSYNQDMVVEHNAPNPPTLATTASMDGGTANTGTSWYEQGYNPAGPATGLPLAGSTITNLSASDHVYTFATSYTAKDVACIDSANSTTLIPVSPIPFSALSFLTASGHGPVGVNYQVSHGDGSFENGAFSSPDWFNNMPVVYNCQGRVNVTTGAFDSVNNNNPRLYFRDVLLTNVTSPVTGINLSWNSGSGEAAVFSVSGVANPSSISIPLTISYNGGLATLTWPLGHLLQATSINGPWSTNSLATSPFVVVPTVPSMFYRIR